MLQNSNFWLPRGQRFFANKLSYGYGAKSRWGPPRVHLGANGVPLGKTMGQNREKLPCPKIRNLGYPAVILGPMRSHWVKKMGQNRKNYHAPKFEFLATPPRGHRFLAKNRSYSYGAKSRCGQPRVHLGANGVPLGKTMGQNRKKLPCPKIRIFGGHRFFAKNRSYGYGAKSWWGPPRVHLGVNGVPLGKRNGSKPQKMTMPEIRIFGYPAVIDFSKKIEVTVMALNHGGDPILGPMGSHWVQKMGQNRKNYHASKFEFLAIDFSQKIEVTVMAPNHGGDPLGFILGPMGSHWIQKMGSNGKKLPCPKIRIFGGHRFFAKNRSYGYGAKSRWGPPRVHLGANEVPLDPKNGSKP